MSTNLNEYKEIATSNRSLLRVPSYLKDVYYWAYLNPNNVAKLDRNIVVDILLFGNARRLIRTYLDEINAGDKMLQVAHVYGDLIKHIAQKVGDTGHLDLIDVAPIQLEQAQKKLEGFNNADLWQQDATLPYQDSYTVIGSFFLLHEVPSKEKALIINNILNKVEKDNSKAVFIDYHRPLSYHPVKYILYCVNRFLEPYAYELWQKEIMDFAKDRTKFNCTKETLFGGVYQKVVVTKKSIKNNSSSIIKAC